MFETFKFKPFKHYSSDKRKISRKKHNFDLGKSDFYPPEGHSCSELLAVQGEDTKNVSMFTEELGGQKKQHGFLPLKFTP